MAFYSIIYSMTVLNCIHFNNNATPQKIKKYLIKLKSVKQNKNGLLIRMSLVRVQLPEPHFTPSCQRAVFVWISKHFHSSIIALLKRAIFQALSNYIIKKARNLTLFCILSILRLFVVAYFLTLCILRFILNLYHPKHKDIKCPQIPTS